MAHSILRLRKLHAAELAPCGRHNFRCFQGGGEVVLAEEEVDVYEEHPDTYIPQSYRYARQHIDFEKSRLNEYIGYSKSQGEVAYVENKKTDILPLQEQIAMREKELNIKGIRKDSIHALELVLTVSNCQKFLDSNNYSESGFSGLIMDFTTKYFSQLAKDDIDRNPVVAAAIHKDESNWHMHLIVQPTITKEYKSKNRYGETVRKETRLAIRTILGDHTWDKQPLRNMQTAWNEFLQKRFNYRNGEKIEGICRVEEQRKQYIEQTNAELGKIAKRFLIIQQLMKKVENSEQWDELKKKWEELKIKEAEVKEQFEKQQQELAKKEASQKAIKKASEMEQRRDKEPERLSRRRSGFRL